VKITVTFEGIKDRLHRAYRTAKAVEAQLAAQYGRSMLARSRSRRGQPVKRAVAMLYGTAVVRETAAERKAWPQRIRVAGFAAKAQSDGGGCGGPVLKMKKPQDVTRVPW
jgi:hypothetical protein